MQLLNQCFLLLANIWDTIGKSMKNALYVRTVVSQKVLHDLDQKK